MTQPENVEFCKRHNVVVLIDRLQGPFEGNVLPLVYMRRGNYIVLKSFYTGVSVVLGVDVTFFNDFLRKSVGVQQIYNNYWSIFYANFFISSYKYR